MEAISVFVVIAAVCLIAHFMKSLWGGVAGQVPGQEVRRRERCARQGPAHDQTSDPNSSPSGIVTMTIKKGDVFIRNVVERDQNVPLDAKYKCPFPNGHWFWCFPKRDRSASLSGRTTFHVFQYTARQDFKVAYAGASLKSVLEEHNFKDLLAFERMGNKVNEKNLLQAVLPLHVGQGIVGITRTIGSGPEFVFFSQSAERVLEVHEL